MRGSKKLVAVSVGARTCEGDGFLRLHRVTVHNEYQDGSRSAPYVTEYVDRPRGMSAVVVVLWRRRVQEDSTGGIEVLVRGAPRHAMFLATAPAAQTRFVEGLTFPEVVAGLVEVDDVGDLGRAQRVCAEVHEEAGYVTSPDEVQWLGAPSAPSPGVIPEWLYFAAVEVTGATPWQSPSGDGSPFEEGAEVRWLGLEAALAACWRGELADSKSELALRRFAERHVHDHATT